MFFPRTGAWTLLSAQRAEPAHPPRCWPHTGGAPPWPGRELMALLSVSTSMLPDAAILGPLTPPPKKQRARRAQDHPRLHLQCCPGRARSAGQQVEPVADGHVSPRSLGHANRFTNALREAGWGAGVGGVAAVGRLDTPDSSLCLRLRFPVCEAVTMLPRGPGFN